MEENKSQATIVLEVMRKRIHSEGNPNFAMTVHQIAQEVMANYPNFKKKQAVWAVNRLVKNKQIYRSGSDPDFPMRALYAIKSDFLQQQQEEERKVETSPPLQTETGGDLVDTFIRLMPVGELFTYSVLRKATRLKNPSGYLLPYLSNGTIKKRTAQEQTARGIKKAVYYVKEKDWAPVARRGPRQKIVKPEKIVEIPKPIEVSKVEVKVDYDEFIAAWIDQVVELRFQSQELHMQLIGVVRENKILVEKMKKCEHDYDELLVERDMLVEKLRITQKFITNRKGISLDEFKQMIDGVNKAFKLKVGGKDVAI